MKILCIGDEHFENKNEIESTQMCDKIYQIVLEETPDIIISLGDVLHSHSNIYMGPLKRAILFFHRLSQLTQHLYILIGNHDRPNNTAFLTDDSPFVACKMWPNTTVVDRVYTDDVNKLIFAPFVAPGRFMEALQTQGINDLNIREYKAIFAHQEFEGCKMGMITSVHGDKWNPEYPLCISGHIHEYQQPQHNLIYPGTPIQLGYGTPPAKGVMLMNISEDDISHKFIDLDMCKKMIVHLTAEQLAVYKLPDNCFVKLVCKGDTKTIREITKLENVKELLKNPRVRLSIQEDRKKEGPALPEGVFDKAETITFQKRLSSVIQKETADTQSLFQKLFGKLQTNI